MTLEQIAQLGRKLILFLALFADCFVGSRGRKLLRTYVKGQLSDVQRKNVEAIALRFNTPPRTLQRFLESIKWDEEKLRDRCQQIVATEHAHQDAIGCIDESGNTKSGPETVGAARQWNGRLGKVDNCMVGVHLSYSALGFQVLLDSRVYLPEAWATDPVRRKTHYIPEDIEFQTKPQIALEQVKHALGNGIRVSAWTFDEFYGRDGKFLDGLESLGQVFVGEIPNNFHGWVQSPIVIRTTPGKSDRRNQKRRVARRTRSCEVRNLAGYSPVFLQQSWQPYRVKDSNKGPEVWEIKWAVFWRKDEHGLPTRRHCLIVARHVLTGNLKYFLSNRVPGERNPVNGQNITVRGLLRVAFGRWSIESCLREGKEELGLDHFEVRGWRCVHRHYYVTQLSHLFCARVRQEYDDASENKADRITVEQVRSAINVWLEAADLPTTQRRERFATELSKQLRYQERNAQSRQAHTKTRLERLAQIGIDVDKIKSCISGNSP
jgi:SRSO17 transposase